MHFCLQAPHKIVYYTCPILELGESPELPDETKDSFA